jgi:hypothetical protein
MSRDTRGSAREAGPLLYLAAGVASLAGVVGLIGCSATARPGGTPADEPPKIAVEDSSWTGYTLLIAPILDETAARDVTKGYMADFRDEIQASLAAIDLFSWIPAEGAHEPYLVLQPIILLDKITSPEDLPVAEMEMRFELSVSGSRGLIWHAEYSERSAEEIRYQAQFPERQRFLATRSIRRRILDSLRRDLTRFVIGY